MWNRFLLVRAGARAVGVACNRCMQRVLDVYRPSAGSRRILRKFSDVIDIDIDILIAIDIYIDICYIRH